jgi:iron complex transport system ATP-binding protein
MDILLSLENVSVIQSQKKLVDNLNIQIPLGQNTAILGPNGSGKSTLVKLISRHIHPYGGGNGLKILGQERIPVFELRKQLGIVSSNEQFYFDGDPPIEVYDAVLSGFFAGRGVWIHDEVNDDMLLRADEALTEMGVSHLRGRAMRELSTGEARRVLIARALVHRPKALLLDEPCAGLDPAARHQFLNALRQISQNGVTLILVTHHIEEILPEIQHVVLLGGGQVFKEGSKKELLVDSTLSELFGIPLQVSENGDWYASKINHTETCNN